MVQLYELDSWADWLDFPTAQEAFARAAATGWGANVRVRQRKRVLWQGISRPKQGTH
jgi:hypothetical protein